MYLCYIKSHFHKNLIQALESNIPWDHADIKNAWKIQNYKVLRSFYQKYSWLHNVSM